MTLPPLLFAVMFPPLAVLISIASVLSTSIHLFYANNPNPQTSQTTTLEASNSARIAVNPSPIPSPTPSSSARPSAPKPTPKPTTPPTPAPTPHPDYSSLIFVSPDAINQEVQFSEPKKVTITITNQSNESISWVATRPTCSVDGNCPINLESWANQQNLLPGSTEETTASLWANSYKPEVTAEFLFTFKSVSTGNVLTEKKIRVTAKSPVSPDTVIQSSGTTNPNLNISFSPKAIYPIVLENTHTTNLNWTATVSPTSAVYQVNYDGKSGWFRPGEKWQTTLALPDSLDNQINLSITFTFKDDQNATIGSRTLAITISR